MYPAPSSLASPPRQFPQVDRKLLMVHCFFYPNGLDGQVGDLMVQPRSQKVVMDRGRDVFGHLFGQLQNTST